MGGRGSVKFYGFSCPVSKNGNELEWHVSESKPGQFSQYSLNCAAMFLDLFIPPVLNRAWRSESHNWERRGLCRLSFDCRNCFIEDSLPSPSSQTSHMCIQGFQQFVDRGCQFRYISKLRLSSGAPLTNMICKSDLTFLVYAFSRASPHCPHAFNRRRQLRWCSK